MQYAMPFIVAMIVAMAWLPLLAKVAAKWGIVDQPGTRKVHSAPIPRVGGLAMAIGVFVAALIAIDLQVQDRWFLGAAAVLVAFGALDDRFDLDYRVKLIGQLLAVVIVVVVGDVHIRAITLDDRVMLPEWVSVPLTIFFLVGITNAVNLADGLDGLAGGTTFLCLCAVALLLSSVGDQNAGTALCLAFAGAVLGFLRFNTYPATVFMGDAGSQLLGFTIGVLSIRATQSFASQFSAAIPILLLAIPILDTLSVMAQRIGEGRSPFSPDKNHIHHKLLALGFGHHEAVMVIYSMQATLFVAAYFLRFESDLTILAFVTTFFVLSITIMQLAARSGWRLRDASGAAAASALSRILTVLQQPKLLPWYSYLAIVLALAVYAALIVLETNAVSSDIRILILALFAVTTGLLVILRAAPLSVVEKAALYVTATVLVYLDAVALPADRLVSILTWLAISIAAIATAVRLRLHNDRRFQVTPLDLIVLFMALIVPSLPGTFNLPHGGVMAIVKLVILFYAIEVLVSRSEGRAVWVRIAVVSTLAGLAVRPLMSF
jgi:UDP-GlcNAc:undecaprenyl-phosphate/decaprenyl-phosphate GlcNAc-1-phosphate transferase